MTLRLKPQNKYGAERTEIAAPSERECILGVDPGLSGALAWYWPADAGVILAEDVPVVSTEIDAVTLTAALKRRRPAHAWVEMVHSMPKQGVASSFKLGRAYGVVTGVIQALEIPMTLVTPNVWKKAYRLDSDKEKARALALRLWPSSTRFSRKKDHGRSEAALLARYGAGHAVKLSEVA